MRNLFFEMPDFVCNHDLHKCSFSYKFNGKTIEADAFCTDERIADKDVPEGLFKYEIRSADDSEEWATIEKKVGVNHIATIITDQEIFLAEHGSGDFYNEIVCDDVDYGDYYNDDVDEDEVNEMLVNRLGELMDLSDAQAIADEITDEVAQDVRDTADLECWNSGDVEIALVRVLKKRLGIED